MKVVSIVVLFFTFLQSIIVVEGVRVFASCTFPSFCNSEVTSGSSEYFLKVMQIKRVLYAQEDRFKERINHKSIHLFLLPPLHFDCLLSELEIILIAPQRCQKNKSPN